MNRIQHTLAAARFFLIAFTITGCLHLTFGCTPGDQQNENTKQPSAKKQAESVINYSNNQFVKMSQEFIQTLKKGGNTDTFVSQLETVSLDELEKNLKTPNEKKAFWLNVYNGLVQYLLTDNPDLYENRSDFFSDQLFTIAGIEMSLDDVEHGILRDSRIKVSLGHVQNPFPPAYEKKLRVEEVDWRIHFALNCGAKSCPPVKTYDDEKLDEQLDESSDHYLSQQVNYNESENAVYVPRLMDWFRADFGGKSGVKKILKNRQLIPQSSDPEVKFTDYDWTLDLNNFQ